MAYKDSLILYLKMILLCGIIYLILILIPQLCIDKRNTILISIIIVGCVYILYINNNNINELYTNNNVTQTLTKNPSDYKNDEINKIPEKSVNTEKPENINQINKTNEPSYIHPINPVQLEEQKKLLLNELTKITQNPTPTTYNIVKYENPEKKLDYDSLLLLLAELNKIPQNPTSKPQKPTSIPQQPVKYENSEDKIKDQKVSLLLTELNKIIQTRAHTPTPTSTSTPVPTPTPTPTTQTLVKLVDSQRPTLTSLLNNLIETSPKNNNEQSSICDIKINNLKSEFNKQLNDLKSNNIKYYQTLLNHIYNKKMIDYNDVNNIQTQYNKGLISLEDIINVLEQIKDNGNVKEPNTIYNQPYNNFMKPIGDKISNAWANDYTILNTDHWAVPMKRPPVCVTNSPCKVCPTDSSNYPVNLLHWDNARNITNNQEVT